MRAIDTNVLVRALVQDDPIQARRAESAIKAGPVYIPVTVILEFEWILRSRYGFTATAISKAIQKLAVLEGATVGERDAVIDAARRLNEGWDFADALHHALAAGCEDFVTFDRDLARRATRTRSLKPPVVAL